jgi:hypothetical protein
MTLKEQFDNMFSYLDISAALNERDKKQRELISQIYNDKHVLFIVPLTMTWVKNHPHLPMDVTCWLYPESKLTLANQRHWVESNLLTAKNRRHCVVTTSATILSDAFNLQIWSEKENGAYASCGISTFGASPDRISLHTMSIPEAIGSLSDRKMDEWLQKEDWTKDELEIVVQNIGGGWTRAKLTELCKSLETTKEQK